MKYHYGRFKRDFTNSRGETSADYCFSTYERKLSSYNFHELFGENLSKEEFSEKFYNHVFTILDDEYDHGYCKLLIGEKFLYGFYYRRFDLLESSEFPTKFIED